jgi:hypothetical protein
MKKISGFTLVRNGSKFDYPYVESLRSLLPLVDELVINVGKGDDDTLQVIEAFSKNEGQGKVVIFESHWPLDDPEKKRGGQILAEQTNLALDRCTGEWCIYLQADEVLHENDHAAITHAMQTHEDNPKVDGLLFQYIHFYGSFDVIRFSRSAYRREVRAIKKTSGCRSIGDAQSFRKPDGSKPNVAWSNASVYHYGWVRPPEVMKAKTHFMDQLYHGTNIQSAPQTGDNYRYKKIWGLLPFLGSHPQYMQKRVKEKNWNWDLKNSPLEWQWSDAKKVVLDTIERFTGIRLFEYKSYKKVRP